MTTLNQRIVEIFIDYRIYEGSFATDEHFKQIADQILTLLTNKQKKDYNKINEEKMSSLQKRKKSQ